MVTTCLPNNANISSHRTLRYCLFSTSHPKSVMAFASLTCVCCFFFLCRPLNLCDIMPYGFSVSVCVVKCHKSLCYTRLQTCGYIQRLLLSNLDNQSALDAGCYWRQMSYSLISAMCAVPSELLTLYYMHVTYILRQTLVGHCLCLFCWMSEKMIVYLCQSHELI